MTTTTRWWWIRHAPVTTSNGRIYGQDDLPCDCSDRVAFQRLAALMPSDAIWVTSHLQRTRQTAEAIVEHMPRFQESGDAAFAPLAEQDLAEQHFGDWQGLTNEEVAARRDGGWHKFWLAPAHESPPGGESFAQVVARVTATVERLSGEYRGNDIVAVTHGGTIRAAMAHALGLDPERALAIAVDNCALTRLDYITGPHSSHLPEANGAWRVGLVNATARTFD